MTRVRLALYLLAGLVLAFEGAVAALMLVPHVSEDYRAFFIDRSTDCWPLPIAGGYRLGTTISFVSGAPSAPATAVKVCGWTDPADTGTWSVGEQARLRFRLALPPADVLIGLDMLAFLAGPLQEQRVEVFANGEHIDTLRLGPGSKGLKLFRVPRRLVLHHWGYLDFVMRFPDAASPASLGVNNDRRELAIRLLSGRLWYDTARWVEGPPPLPWTPWMASGARGT